MSCIIDTTDPVKNLQAAGQYIKDHAAELIGDYKNEPIASVRVVIDPDGAEKLPHITVRRKILVFQEPSAGDNFID